MIQVGDVWEDFSGEHVEIVRKSVNKPDHWWVKNVGYNLESVRHTSELIKMIHGAPTLPGLWGGGTYSAPVTGIYQTSDSNIRTFGYTDGVWGEVKSEEYKPITCDHEWVDAGFHFSVWCCRKCNIDKPKDSV